MTTRWYRSHCGLVTDAKLAEAAVVAGCSRAVVIAAWHAILESCAEANDGGRFDTTARRVSAILAEPGDRIEAVFAAFVDLGMIAAGCVTAWSRRQFESDSSTERSRKHREAKRSGELMRAHFVDPPAAGDRTPQPSTAAPPASATAVQRCATAPDTETDSDPPPLPFRPPAARGATVGEGETFEGFWRAMPSPDPAAKAAAMVAFGRLCPTDRAQAVVAAGRYAAAFAAKPTTRPISPARFLRDRCFEGYGAAVATGEAQVFVKLDSPQWKAWRAHRGKPIPLNREGGWCFPTEWPPDVERGAA